jgi:hypothetical protein
VVGKRKGKGSAERRAEKRALSRFSADDGWEPFSREYDHGDGPFTLRGYIRKGIVVHRKRLLRPFVSHGGTWAFPAESSRRWQIAEARTGLSILGNRLSDGNKGMDWFPLDVAKLLGERLASRFDWTTYSQDTHGAALVAMEETMEEELTRRRMLTALLAPAVTAIPLEKVAGRYWCHNCGHQRMKHYPLGGGPCMVLRCACKAYR